MTGGVGAYQYGIFYPAPANPLVEIYNGFSKMFTNLPVGNYTVVVRDGNMCSATSLVNISSNPPIVIDSVMIVKPACFGYTNGLISVWASGGVGSFTYVFQGQQFTNTTQFTDLTTGSYPLTIIDSLGCTKDTLIFVGEPQVLSASYQKISDNGCSFGQSSGAVQASAAGGTPPYNYLLKPIPIPSTTGYYSNLPGGTYTVETVDSRGCTTTAIVFDISNGGNLEAEIEITPVTCGGKFSNATATVSVSGGTAPYIYAFSNGQTSYSNTQDSLAAGYYEVLITDSVGCFTTDTFTIDPSPCCDVYLGNAFTPNNDLLNDGYRALSSASYKLIMFAIFDRWGNKVFETTDANKAWDGKYNDQDCDQGSYYVVYQYRCLWDNLIYLKKGDVILVR
jgi:gliding motility-associated-like protein